MKWSRDFSVLLLNTKPGLKRVSLRTGSEPISCSSYPANIHGYDWM